MVFYLRMRSMRKKMDEAGRIFYVIPWKRHGDKILFASFRNDILLALQIGHFHECTLKLVEHSRAKCRNFRSYHGDIWRSQLTISLKRDTLVSRLLEERKESRTRTVRILICCEIFRRKLPSRIPHRYCALLRLPVVTRGTKAKQTPRSARY